MPDRANVPAIAGFHPDPTICRAGERWYLANSSFEYFPGAPVATSTDLVRWEPVGNVVAEPRQFPLGAGADSQGILGSTLRFHGGRFWFATTNANDFAAGPAVFTATDPAGPWSGPVHVGGLFGFDPDLSWDESGTCRMTYATVDPAPGGSGTVIAQAVVDPDTGEVLRGQQVLWRGSGLGHVEGPHLYRVGDWWYLIGAEGGTGRGHCVTVARSRSPEGPFEDDPANPVLTHRGTDSPVQATGHADLVEGPDGWALVYLGVRVHGNGSERFHVLGRETFVAGVDWTGDGWFRVDEERYPVPERDASFTERFDTGVLDPRWIAPAAYPSDFTRPAADGLVLHTGNGRRALTTRMGDRQWELSADLTPEPGATGGIVLRLTSRFWYGLLVADGFVTAHAELGAAGLDLARVEVPAGRVRLGFRVTRTEDDGLVRADAPDEVAFVVVGSGGGEREIARFDGRFLSSEVAGGFTGRVVGPFVDVGELTVHRVAYRPL